MPPRKRPAASKGKEDGEGRQAKRTKREEEEVEAKEAEDDKSRQTKTKGKLTFVKASTVRVTSSSSSSSSTAVVTTKEAGRYPLRRSSGRVQAAYVPQPWSPRQSAPRVEVNPREGPNFLFYSNVRPSRPSGDVIDRVHKRWWGDYKKLEAHHGYIQWLFPLFEGGGMNYQSARLTKGEAKLMRESVQIAMRVVKSYQLMLDFYGLRLVDKHTGQVKRAKHWLSRYRNMNSHTHNNLRITRILTSLGHLGFARWKKPLVDFFAVQILEKGHLRACRNALLNYWAPTLDVESKEFIKKTGELAQDRTESIYFRYLEKGEIPESEGEEDERDYDDDGVSSSSESEEERKPAARGKGKGKDKAKDDEDEEEEDEEKTKPRTARRTKGKK